MKVIKAIWLLIFLAGSGYFLLFSISAGSLSVVDGPVAQFSALMTFLLSLICLNIALTGFLVFDRMSKN